MFGLGSIFGGCFQFLQLLLDLRRELRLEAVLNHYVFSCRLKMNLARRSVVHGCRDGGPSPSGRKNTPNVRELSRL
jgi:hypothetical protein